MAARIFTSVTDPLLIDMLMQGAIGILPTDTVYGLVGAARNEQAVAKMYAVKNRPRQPGTTIAATVDHLKDIGFPGDALERAKTYWPNPVSVEMNTTGIPSYLSTGQAVMAARIPDDTELRELLDKTGPLMTTSANRPGEPTATTVQSAMAYFGDSIDFYVDAGNLGERPPSTIIGFDEHGDVVVYRQGAVSV